MAKSDSKAIPSGKVYRQLFDAQGQLSKSLLAGRKNSRTQVNTQCSTANSEKEVVDTDDSEDVRGLPDSVVTSASSSEVIQRFAEKKKAKHQDTLKHLDIELTAISKMFESHASSLGEKLLSSLHEIDLKLDKLSHEMELTEEMKSCCMKDMDSLWEEVELQVCLKKNTIQEFCSSLSQSETQRSIQIQAVLKSHFVQLEQISFLILSDIHRLFHSKATMLNQSLLANQRSISELRLNLLVRNLQRASILHQRWKDSVEQWRSYKINQIIQNFSVLCSKDLADDLFSENANIHKIKQSLREASLKRKELINSLCSHVPPPSDLVSDWFDCLKSSNQQIDGIHADLFKEIHSSYDQARQEQLEEVHCCEEALQDLQLSQSKVVNIVSSHLLPLIGQSQTKADEQMAALDVNCKTLSHHSLSVSSSAHRLMQHASLLFEGLSSNLKNTELQIQQDLEILRHEQWDLIQRKTLPLEEALCLLQQASNEETLKESLDTALMELQELQDSCRQNVTGQIAVVNRLPAMYLQELQIYSSRLSAFFHLNSVYAPIQDDLDPAFRDLDLTTTVIKTQEDMEMSPGRDQCKEDSVLLDLCFSNSSEEWSSSKGLIYSGPGFTFDSQEMDQRLKSLQLEVFPVALLSQTLSRVRIMFVDHLEQHFQRSLLCALSLLSHLKEDVLSERDVQLKLLSPQDVHTQVYQPRLAELQLHQQQIDLHSDKVSQSICSGNSEVMLFLESLSKKKQAFLGVVCDLESRLEAVRSLQQLETLRSALMDSLAKYSADTHIARINFSNSVPVQLKQLEQATSQLLCSFRLFSEGGNFTPHETEMFQKSLEKDLNKIKMAEDSVPLESIHAEVQNVNLNTLQEKMTSLESEFIFVDRTKHILRSTKIKIKSVTSNINQQLSHTSIQIQELEKLLEDKESQECRSKVCASLHSVCRELYQRAQYLDYALNSEEHPSHGPTESLNRDRTVASAQTKPSADAGPSRQMKKRDSLPTMRVSRAHKVDWRPQMLGVRPEPGQETLTCSSTVRALLWNASDALIPVAKDFYKSILIVNHLRMVPDSFEQWTDSIQRRLLEYLELANHAFSLSKNEFMKQVSSMEKVCLILPKVLIHKHEQLYQEKVRTEMDRIRQELDQTVADSEKDKRNIVSQLRACISDETLQTVILGEQHRQQQLTKAIDSSVEALRTCLRSTADDFVMSLATLTEILMRLFDMLITTDEIRAASPQSEKTGGMDRGLHFDKRTWSGIPYFHKSRDTTASITTNKCTQLQELVMQERDAAVKSFGEQQKNETLRLDSDKNARLKDLENWSNHWRHQLHTLTHASN